MSNSNEKLVEEQREEMVQLNGKIGRERSSSCSCIHSCVCIGNNLGMSALYPEMKFSWEIKSVDELFYNNLNRFGDLSKEAMLQAIKDKDIRFLQDDSNKSFLSEKKFSKECIRACVKETQDMNMIQEFLDFFLQANDETRRNVTFLIREAIKSAVKISCDNLVIGILEYLQSNKKMKTLTDTSEVLEDAVFSATVEQISETLNNILRWNQNNRLKKISAKGKMFGGVLQLKINCSSIVHAAKRNDYERVKILYRYGYRLEQKDNMTDPLKKIELFKALASPSYIVASLENESSEFFCPVKMCFEFAVEANFRKSTIPEYKREYEEIENRCEEYVISLLEQCEDLGEVETFLQTNHGTNHANYILAILDSRMKFVAHERFQYVLLKKFGETEVEDNYAYTNTLWIDMPWFSRFLHVLKQVPCYLLLFLYPFFYPCVYPSASKTTPIPWFCKEWRVPLNRAIYTAFSYMIFITLIISYVLEPPVPYIYWVDALLGVFITSYSLRDIGTAFFLWRLEGPNPNERRFKKRYFTCWNIVNITMDILFLIGLIIRSLEYILDGPIVQVAAVEAAGRIFWGVAFTLAIIKTIKIGIASKHFGPIILSINMMVKDVCMFLLTFFVIMVAFSCGVSYMFNYMGNGSSTSTHGIFSYFAWVLLQPFRGNPDYDEVTNLPFDPACLSNLVTKTSEINTNSIGACRMATMYNTSCMVERIKQTMPGKLYKSDMFECIISRRLGEENLKTAVVPMWVIYQFLVSVVLLRILIVMMTITYRKIYDNLDTQWKYARLNLAIQFFDQDSLLPPPFTYLTLLMYLIRSIAKKGSRSKEKDCGHVNKRDSQIPSEYKNLLFAFIDNVKPSPKPERLKGKD